MINVTNISDLGKQRFVPEAFEHYTKLYSENNADKFKNAGSFQVPNGMFDPVEYRVVGSQKADYHWMIIDDPHGNYWCLSWEEDHYGYYNHKVIEVFSRYQNGIVTWYDKSTRSTLSLFGENSSLPVKEEYCLQGA